MGVIEGESVGTKDEPERDESVGEDVGLEVLLKGVKEVAAEEEEGEMSSLSANACADKEGKAVEVECSCEEL